MRLTLAACILAAVSFPAAGTERPKPPAPPQPSVTVHNQGGAGGAGGRGGDASARSRSASTSGANVDASSRNQAVIAPSLGGMASGPCTGAGGGASFGVLGFAAGAQGTTIDDRCTARETARVLLLVGLAAEARDVMLREYRRVMGQPAEAPAASRFNEGGR